MAPGSAGVFWMVSFIDEELVFPKNFDQPDFLNGVQFANGKLGCLSHF